ncbi:MAG: electron transport complex subunit RsxC [Lachnospiraceae bacterium]|nr:electron transport complex subunit RsxC [Lachnospiraceae bacterium]
MAARTFKGGVHPYDGKDLSKDVNTASLLPKGDLVYPMSQHIGAPAKAVVAKGDKVLVGQKIGEASGNLSANVISSVSGTVKAVEPRLTVAGTMVESVVIENDKEYTTIEGLGEKRDYTKLSKKEIREIIKEAGIVGMGGAGFPTHVKLTPENDAAIDYVIVNGSECEPYLTSDYRMMVEEPERIITGLKIVLRLFENAKGVIAVEDNKKDAIAKLTELAASEDRIEVMALKTKYPQGAERQLMYAVTKRETNASMHPADAGCIVNNVDTMISIAFAVAESTPLVRRIITVSGDAITSPVNFNVLTGTNYAELVEAAGGFKEKPAKLISGGPMMGQAIYSLDLPVTKTSSALLAFVRDEEAESVESPCIRCGRCVAVCPSRLLPNRLTQLSLRSDYEGFEKMYGLECCECGSCSYVCPSKRHLTQAIKQGKKAVMDLHKKNK